MPRLILLALVVCALGGCRQPGADRREDAVREAAEDARAAVEIAPQKLIARTPVRPYPEAAVVRLFVESGRDAEGRAVFIEPQGRRLGRDRRRAIEATLSTASYDKPPDAVAACFIPHHFLRYYDASGRQIGEIAICFCCTGIQSDPDITGARASGAGYAELEFDYDALKAIIHGMGLRTDFECSPDEI